MNYDQLFLDKVIEKFDHEMNSLHQDRKEELTDQHVEYLKRYPEINYLISDQLNSVFVSKPKDLQTQTRSHFAPFNVKQNPVVPFVIVGTKCSGKLTLIKELCNEFYNKVDTICVITDAEEHMHQVNNIDQTFITKQDFDDLSRTKNLAVEWEENGARYGIKKNQIETCKKRSVISLIRTSKAGAVAMLERKCGWNMVSVTLENEDKLRMRINRKQNDRNLRKVMLEQGKTELEEFNQAEIVEKCIINKDRDNSYDELRTHFIKMQEDLLL